MLHKYKPLIFDAKSKKKLLHQKGTYFYKQKWFNYSIPALCSIALLVGIYMALFPITKLSVNAEEDYGIDTQALATSTITLTMDPNPTYNPDIATNSSTSVTAGTVAYRQYNFNAKVGNSTGYRIYVQAAEGYTGNLRGLAHPNEQITGVGTDVATNAFPVNTWGYSLTDVTSTANASLTYSTIPGYGSNRSAKTIENATLDAGTDYKLVFAAKIENKPADHYQTKVLLSLAARPSTLTTLSGITTMQQITPEICIDSKVGDTAYLRDSRDWKMYWVAKLADDNCWMTQNLDFDVSTVGATLSHSSSDLTSSAFLRALKYTDSVDGWRNGREEIEYYDPGLYVYANPTTLTDSCGNVYKLSDCEGRGWIKVGSGTDWPNASTSSTLTSATSGSTYNAHYLVGNYYSWDAATADTAVSNGVAGGSICPKGWTLPLGGDNFKTTNGSFDFLFSKYTNGANTNAAVAPFYYVRGGNLWSNGTTGALYGPVGVRANYWSKVLSSTSSDRAYYMSYTTNLSVTNNARFIGSFVRCVAVTR